MIKLNIKDNTNFWFERSIGDRKVFFSGYISVYGKTLEKELALDYINRIIGNIKQLDTYNIFEQLNGSWSIVILENDSALIAVDVIKSRPLYYSSNNGEVIISDCDRNVLNSNKIEIVEKNVDYYKEHFVAPPGETIVKDVYDVKPGHCVYFGNNTYKEYKYFYLPAKLSYAPLDILFDEAYSIFISVFNRLKNYLENHKNSTILLPLSGGMDSRLIAYYLKVLEVQNKIIAYTYGKSEDVEEAKISYQVAQELGFEWEFVQYTSDMWKDLGQDLENRIEINSSLKTLVHLQDYLAIEKLSKKYNDVIVIPGLCFDVLAGLTIPKELWVANNSFIFATNKKNQIYDNDLLNYEEYKIQTRLSGYILNSLRIYEKFGCQYYLPYWDIELVKFWYRLPTEYRINRYLFNQLVKAKIYVGDYRRLLEIPYALGRSHEGDIVKIGNIFKLKLRAKKMIKIIFPDFMKKVKRMRKANNCKDDYLGMSAMFNDDRSSDPLQKLCEYYIEIVRKQVRNIDK
ncbi:MAG: hypothetical protein MI717_11940 [Spirochaetales bacterium]|nr:hypothetical protein [Spirochaetales bacterium]